MRESFGFKDGARVKSKDAALVAATLGRIREKCGALTPRSVWKESRSEAAPLHGEFEWNNGRAADLYRDEQARHLIQAVVTGDGGAPRYFEAVIIAGTSQYVPVAEAMSTEETRAQVLSCAKRDLAGAVKHLASLESMVLRERGGGSAPIRKALRQSRAALDSLGA